MPHFAMNCACSCLKINKKWSDYLIVVLLDVLESWKIVVWHKIKGKFVVLEPAEILAVEDVFQKIKTCPFKKIKSEKTNEARNKINPVLKSRWCVVFVC